jgi:SAM-dependent methyltransferase
VVDLDSFGAALQRVDTGYWRTCGGPSDVAYPEHGSDLCFALEDESFWFRHRNDCLVDLVKRYPPQGPLFDVGGGNGVVAAALQRAGVPVVLVEPLQRGVDNARRRGCDTVVCGSLEQAGFPDESLPAVGMFDVLEHINEDRAFLSFVRAQLQPGGRLYLTVPAFAALWSDDDDFAGHFRRYTLPLLNRTLTATGFVVDFQTYFFWFLPAPLLLLRTLPSWFGLRADPGGAQTRREHKQASGWTQALLERCLLLERQRLARRRPIPLGTSCLIAARRSSRSQARVARAEPCRP